MLIVGVIREIVGNGTLLTGTSYEFHVFGSSYQPALIMILPPGAFILIGYLVGLSKMLNEHLEKKKAAFKSEEAGA
jgi:electron transport complex protein RnfE